MQLDRSLFLSPHLDDAVFACGEAIATAHSPVVATLFAGRPPPGTATTAWDAQCGFTPDADVVGARRGEDREALELLDARPVWLEFRDDQYGEAATMADLTAAIDAVLAEHGIETVFFPLGLFHKDHIRASDAAIACRGTHQALRWYAYEDAIYRRIDHLIDERLAALRARGIALKRENLQADKSAHARKRLAVACYRSQLRGLGTRRGHDDAFAPEAYWRVDKGAEGP